MMGMRLFPPSFRVFSRVLVKLEGSRRRVFTSAARLGAMTSRPLWPMRFQETRSPLRALATRLSPSFQVVAGTRNLTLYKPLTSWPPPFRSYGDGLLTMAVLPQGGLDLQDQPPELRHEGLKLHEDATVQVIGGGGAQKRG